MSSKHPKRVSEYWFVKAGAAIFARIVTFDTCEGDVAAREPCPRASRAHQSEDIFLSVNCNELYLEFIIGRLTPVRYISRVVQHATCDWPVVRWLFDTSLGSRGATQQEASARTGQTKASVVSLRCFSETPAKKPRVSGCVARRRCRRPARWPPRAPRRRHFCTRLAWAPRRMSARAHLASRDRAWLISMRPGRTG